MDRRLPGVSRGSSRAHQERNWVFQRHSIPHQELQLNPHSNGQGGHFSGGETDKRKERACSFHNLSILFISIIPPPPAPLSVYVPVPGSAGAPERVGEKQPLPPVLWYSRQRRAFRVGMSGMPVAMGRGERNSQYLLIQVWSERWGRGSTQHKHITKA